ncbi:hypothetical protein B0I37DRAFT_379099 [Chaetomium sp. MPI-CAGE-AT-0009]|nr:hypothetical protein B0I37DRAFT_379099 [Chaetomium sp. MPI-CAGE-AT-0009]
MRRWLVAIGALSTSYTVCMYTYQSAGPFVSCPKNKTGQVPAVALSAERTTLGRLSEALNVTTSKKDLAKPGLLNKAETPVPYRATPGQCRCWGRDPGRRVPLSAPVGGPLARRVIRVTTTHPS